METVYIKNMVCSRCIMVVEQVFNSEKIQPAKVALGEIQLSKGLSPAERESVGKKLLRYGFVMIDDKKSRIIEKIKNAIVQLIHHSDENLKTNLSDHIAGELRQDYSFLSNLFSEVEGTTIEKYFIAQRVEKIKELLVYDELSLTEIADQLGYSSVAYLSSQFKKVTGLTPSFYRSLKEHKRKNIEEI